MLKGGATFQSATILKVNQKVEKNTDPSLPPTLDRKKVSFMQKYTQGPQDLVHDTLRTNFKGSFNTSKFCSSGDFSKKFKKINPYLPRK